jgi:hypothetical protein
MNMNLIFPTTLLYDFMHLQFISDIFEKIIYNEVKFLNRENIDKIMSNLNISFV